jgi:hypothetical protein
MHTPTKSELAEEARQQKLYAESLQLLARGCDAGDQPSCEHSEPPREAPKRPIT